MMALDGIKVLDLTRLAPGPFCTMTLADLGADVLKVEEPGGPSGRRAEQAGTANPVMSLILPTESPYNASNRNKRSIALNLKSDKGKEVLYKLAEKADVVVEGMRPGVSRRLGVDYATLKKINPRIVYCGITGYGQTGPYANMVGHDINYISQGGALGAIGSIGGPPVIPLNIIADYAGGGMNATIGILTALIAREKTGRGQFIDISMSDGVVSLLAQIYSDYFFRGNIPSRGAHFTSGKFPYYDVYPTKDGKYITIGSLEPWFYANLCRALGREDLISSQTAPEQEQEKIRAEFRDIFLAKTRDEWFELLKNADICVGKVYTIDEVENDPHFVARQMFVELDHPREGKIKQVGISVKLSETPGSVRKFAPRKGEHTNEVLKQLGYSKESINDMRRRGYVI